MAANYFISERKMLDPVFILRSVVYAPLSMGVESALLHTCILKKSSKSRALANSWICHSVLLRLVENAQSNSFALAFFGRHLLLISQLDFMPESRKSYLLAMITSS